jgi:hypothetical protein
MLSNPSAGSAILSIALSFLVGIVSALLTVFLTPRLQHLFWVRQKRFDLRSKNLEELHLLSAKLFEYLGPDWVTGELTGADTDDRDTEFEDTLARDWHALADRTRFLFSKEACQQLARFNDMLPRVLFHRLPDPPDKAYDIWDKFVQRRHLAFEALYKDLFDYTPTHLSRTLRSVISSIRQRFSM